MTLMALFALACLTNYALTDNTGDLVREYPTSFVVSWEDTLIIRGKEIIVPVEVVYESVTKSK